jgi:hypothetical protein
MGMGHFPQKKCALSLSKPECPLSLSKGAFPAEDRRAVIGEVNRKLEEMAA